MAHLLGIFSVMNAAQGCSDPSSAEAHVNLILVTLPLPKEVGEVRILELSGVDRNSFDFVVNIP